MVGSYRLLVLVIFLLPLTIYGQSQHYEKQNVVRIKFKETYGNKLRTNSFTKTSSNYIKTGVSSVDELNTRYGALQFKPVFSDGGKYAERRRKHGLHLWYEVTFDTSKGQSMQALLDGYSKDIAIQEAEPIYAKQISSIAGIPFGPVKVEFTDTGEGQNYVPNDPRLSEQWHYHNSGQTGGTIGADINLFAAWDVQKGSSDVIVSIHDGGIDINHVDIAANLWVNHAELNGTAGIDDDGNGYVDDVHGYNHADGTGTISAGDHGTHVAGTVAAVNNNGIGVAGVAGGSGTGDGARLMSCQVFGNTNGGFAESYAYAADNGAIISQNSWGYTTAGNYEQAVLDAIDYFIANAGYDENNDPVGPMQGGIVIFASGNSNSSAVRYPGYYEPVLSVASTNHEDQKSWYSNYGSWVDISAPGGETAVTTEGVLSTLPGNNYGFYQGTSMACPHVSGVAALIVAEFGGAGFTPEQLRYRLVETTDDIDSLNPSFTGQLGSGRMNAFAALLSDDGIAPDAINDLSASEIHHNKVKIAWTAPEDEDNVSALSYEIRYSISPITEANFASASLAGLMPAQSFGSSESLVIDQLNSATDYYFAVKSYDFFSNASQISNVLRVATSNPPAISVTPLSLTSNLFTGESETQQIAITNAGEGFLEFSIQTSNTGHNPSAMVVDQTPAFKGLNKPQDKNKTFEESVIYKQGQFKRTTAQPQPSFAPELQVVLDSLELSHGSITSLVPNLFLFSNGDTGTGISDGGNDMYDGGNYLRTDLGGAVSYSNGVLSTSPYLNGESYFTAKYPGLFVFATDLNDQAYFEITGDLGADGSGSVDGAVLNVTRNGKSYLGFIKRVYNAYDPSVNHLIIVEDNSTADHEFSTYTNEDYHRVGNLAGAERLYYLLFASSNGGYIDNDNMLAIMERFLDIAETSTISVGTISGSVASGQTATVDVIFDARDLDAGQYLNHLTIMSNAETGDVIVETTLNVTGAPSISSSATEINFNEVYINDNRQLPVYIKNAGTDVLDISSITVANAVFATDNFSGSIYPKDSLLVNINFNPATVGAFATDLTVESNDPNDPQYVINLIGTAVEPPVIEVSPLLLTENLMTGQTSVKTLTLTNSGEADLNFSLQLEYTASPSSVTEAFSLETFDIEVRNPDSGAKTNIKSEGTEVSLYDLSGLNVAFFNVSGYTVISSDIQARGATVASLYFPLGDISGYDIIIIDDMVESANAADISSLNSYVQNGGKLMLQGDNTNSANNIGQLINGTGVTYTALPSFVTEIITDIANHVTTQDVDSIYSNSYGAYYSNASTVIMRDGSAREHVVVSDKGTGKLFLMGNELLADFDMFSRDNRLFANQVIDWMAGEAGSWLSLSQSAGVVTAQNSLEIEVNFDATNLPGGTYEGNVVIISNDPETQLVEVPVTLSVTDVPHLELSASSIDFVNAYIEHEKIDSIKITNTGNETLHVTGMSLSNADFSVEPSAFSLGDNEERWIVVSISPSEEGLITGTLTINSNDAQNASVDVSLRGYGIYAPQAVVSPGEIRESLTIGEYTSRTIYIGNEGKNMMLYHVYTESASGSSGWLQIFASGSPIGQNKSVSEEILIDATYLNEGEYSGSVVVLTDDPDNHVIRIPVSLSVCATKSSQAPRIVEPIGDQMLDPDAEELTINLKTIFASNKDLEYVAFTNEPAWAHVTVNGHELSINPIIEGVMMVTVQAYDNDCGKVEETFMLSIQQVTAVTEGLLYSGNVKVYPNPMNTSGGSVEVYAERHSEAKIDLLDVNGRIIRKIYDGKLANGLNKIEVPGQGLKPGFYLVKVDLNGNSEVIRLMIN